MTTKFSGVYEPTLQYFLEILEFFPTFENGGSQLWRVTTHKF